MSHLKAALELDLKYKVIFLFNDNKLKNNFKNELIKNIKSLKDFNNLENIFNKTEILEQEFEEIIYYFTYLYYKDLAFKWKKDFLNEVIRKYNILKNINENVFIPNLEFNTNMEESDTNQRLLKLTWPLTIKYHLAIKCIVNKEKGEIIWYMYYKSSPKRKLNENERRILNTIEKNKGTIQTVANNYLNITHNINEKDLLKKMVNALFKE